MQLRYIKLHWIRSFREEQGMDLTRMPCGIYYVTGENQVEQELQANGVGKSSLFESLFWLLFGKTPRSVRAGAVKSWGIKGAGWVEVGLGLGGKEYVIRREQGPNSLSVIEGNGELTAIDQTTLDALINITPEAFLASILFAQFTPSFIDLPPAERMGLYGAVMDLEQWEDRSDAANRSTASLREQIQESEVREAELRGQLESLDVRDLEAQSKLWAAEHAKQLDVAKADAQKLSAEIERLRKKLKSVPPVPQKEIATLQSKLVAVINTRATIQASLQTETAACVKLTRAGRSGRCPTCGAKWTDNTEHTKGHEKTIKRLRAELTTAETAIKAVTEEQTALETATSESRHVQADLVRAEAALPPLQRQMTALQAELNPHVESIRQVRQKQTKVTNAIKTVTADLEETRRLSEATAFWVKGFKDVRLFLIEESLEQLNVEVNECLYQLGLQDWGITFTVEQETKSGTVKRGFQCSVRSPQSGKEVVPWEAWSGGEAQRLRLAVNVGMSNLICQRRGIRPNVEFWDEPSKSLSATGIESLLEMLRDRAQQQNKIILLADHHTLNFGDFSGTLFITKNSTGSHLRLAV